jgi:hypothetical protein
MWFRSSVDPRVGFVCHKNGGTEPNRTLEFTPESKHLRVIGKIIPGREKKHTLSWKSNVPGKSSINETFTAAIAMFTV